MLTAFYLASTESTFHYYMKESHGREHGRLAEDEKIREDSNEGLDSSSSNGGSSSSNDDVAFDAATAVTAVLLAIQL